jgi:tripartite-type tricarboxylate transporter receptor subunit TctC
MARHKYRTLVALLAALGLIAAACGGDEPGDDAELEDVDDAAADADDPAEDDETEAGALAGEDITLTVGVGPGGGYDAYARLLAPYLAEELDADVVVSNEPGAGGLVALNNLLSSEPDGTQIMLINGAGIAGSALAEAEGANFELDELTYLGRVYGGPKLIGAATDTGIEDFDELAEEPPFNYGASGPGASTYVEPTVVMEILGYPYEITTGFDGSTDIIAAAIAGEIDGIMVDLDTLGPHVDDGDYNPLLLVGPDERDDAVPDTPVLAELELDDQQRDLADALQALLELGRALVAHPDTDPEVADELIAAFDSILTSDEFIEEAEAQGRPIGYATADEVDGLVDTILQAPEEFREIVELGY